MFDEDAPLVERLRQGDDLLSRMEAADEIERLRRLVEIGDVRCEACGAPATTIDGDGDAACAGCSA